MQVITGKVLERKRLSPSYSCSKDSMLAFKLKSVSLFVLSLGLVSLSASAKADDNPRYWFIGAQGGASMNWGSYTSYIDFGKRIKPVGNLYVGKWITNWLGARALLGYHQNIGASDKILARNDQRYTYDYTSYSGYVDLMLKLFGNSAFRVNFFAGAGAERTSDFQEKSWYEGEYDTRERFRFGFQGGLQVAVRVASHLALTLEASATCHRNTFDGNDRTDNPFDGRASVLLGLSYRWGGESGSRRHVQHRTYIPASTSTLPPAVKIDKDLSPLHQAFYFDYGGMTVDPDTQMESVLKQVSTSRNMIYVTPRAYANDLFFQRAEAVRNYLLHTCHVAPTRTETREFNRTISQGEECVVIYIGDK